MAYSVNWPTRVVTIPRSDLTLIAPGVYELNVIEFWQEIHDIQDDAEGIPFDDIMRSSPPVTIAGTTFARVVEIINGYTVTFEDGQYAVNLVGANNNIADVLNVNQVSVRSNNSAGLVVTQGVDQETLQRIIDLLEADEVLQQARAIKLHRITKEVLLDKTVTGAPSQVPSEVRLEE